MIRGRGEGRELTQVYTPDCVIRQSYQSLSRPSDRAAKSSDSLPSSVHQTEPTAHTQEEYFCSRDDKYDWF